MISSVQYQILKNLQNGKRISDRENFNELLVLRHKGYVSLIVGQGYILQGDWLREIEEYESAQLSKKQESETLDIAKEANEISKTSNKKSRNANILSLIAIIVPSLISIGSLIVSIFAYLKN